MKLLEGWVSVSEAAKIYGCGVQNIYKHIDRGNIITGSFFGKTLLLRDDVIELRDNTLPRGQARRKRYKKKSKKFH